jgi:hypothetical protein
MGDIAVATGKSPSGEITHELAPPALPEGERVCDTASGLVGSDEALLVVTNRRVLLIREGDERQGGAGLPLSKLRTVQWEPAAQCHSDRGAFRADQSSRAEPGAWWGSVTVGDARQTLRLSLVVARDGERIVALIQSVIAPRSTSTPGSGADRARPGPLRRRAALLTSPPGQWFEPTEVSTTSTGPKPDAAEMSTAVIARQLDPAEALDPVTAPAAGAVVAAKVTPDQGTGRHRGANRNQPRRHSRGRDTKVNPLWPLAAVAVGLGVVVAVGVRVANPPPAAFVGCTTEAGDPGAVARALTAASPGDRICITADLPSFRVAITRGGDTAEPVTVVGDGQTVVGGITVHADNVVVSGFQVLGDPQHAIQIRGNGINVANNMGATGPLTPAWQ